LTTDSKEKIQK